MSSGRLDFDEENIISNSILNQSQSLENKVNLPYIRERLNRMKNTNELH